MAHTSPRRPRRIEERELRVHAALVACALVVVAALSLEGSGTPARFLKPTFPDLAQFLAGARLLGSGDSSLLYVPREFLRAIAAVVPWPQETLFPPVYPAHVYAAFLPLAPLPYGVSAVIFTAGSLVAYVAAVRWLAAPAPVPVTLGWLAFANPALLHVLMSGQLSSFALATLALAWRAWRDGRLFLAGVCLGSLAWKPQLMLFALVAFAVRPRVSLAAGALCASLVHAAFFTLVAGISGWAAYLKVLVLVSSSPEGFSKPHQLQSLKGAIELLMPRGPLSATLLVTLSAMAIGLALFVGRRSDDQRHGFAAIVLAALLISPHVYVYDALLAGAALFLVGQAALERKEHRRSDVVAYLLHWAPLLLPFVEMARVQLVAGCALAWLALAAREVANTAKENPPYDLSA